MKEHLITDTRDLQPDRENLSGEKDIQSSSGMSWFVCFVKFQDLTKKQKLVESQKPFKNILR